MIPARQGRYYQYSSEKNLCLYFGKRQNPCGCDTNCYHLEFDGNEETGEGYVYGCCQECQQDIYRLSGEEVSDMLNVGIWKPLVVEKEEENNMEKKTLVMEHSKYRFEYEEGKEYDFRVFRFDEDVTELVKDNVLADLFYETLDVKTKLAEYEKKFEQMTQWCFDRRNIVPFEDFNLGRIKLEKKEKKIATFDEQMALYKEYEVFLNTLPPENVYSGEELWRLFTEQREDAEVER